MWWNWRPGPRPGATTTMGNLSLAGITGALAGARIDAHWNQSRDAALRRPGTDAEAAAHCHGRAGAGGHWPGVGAARACTRGPKQARARDHSLDGQIARINQERQGYQAMMREPDNAQVLNQAESLNKLFDEKAFSWTLAMEDLETVLPGGVQVTSIEPARDKDGRITLHLRVLGPRDRAIELVSNLEHSQALSASAHRE